MSNKRNASLFIPQPIPVTTQQWGKETIPLVSISCVAYNHERFIHETLQSFLMQETTFPVEMLIHDDASIDETANIIREFEKSYPNLIFPIYQKENQYSQGIKPGMAFNYPRARGKYIALCDGDDYWTDPLKLQKQVEFLENNPDYVLCFHNSKVIDEVGNVLRESRNAKSFRKNYTSEELYQIPPIDTLTICFRNIIKNYPDEMNYCLGADRFLIAILAQHGHGAYLDTISPAAYRSHSGGVYGGSDAISSTINILKTRYYIARYYERIGKHEQAEFILNFKISDMLNEQLSKLQSQIKISDEKVNQLTKEKEYLRIKLAESDSRLADVYSSKIWRLGLRLRRLRLWLAPPGSLQARMGRWILLMASKIRKI